MMQKKEKNVLRELAKRVREISLDPVNDENAALWRRVNSLKRTRPLVLCSVPPETWPELIPESSLVVSDPYFRKIEADLRKRIYRYESLKDDDITTANVYVPFVHTMTNWTEERHRPYAKDTFHSEKFVPCIVSFDDLKKLKLPELTVDRKKTQEHYVNVGEALGDVLNVVLGKPFYAGDYPDSIGWGPSCIDVLCEMRGLEQLYMDFVLNPDFIREAMSFLTSGVLKMLDQLEKEGVLYPNANEFVVGSGHTGYVDGLPSSKRADERVRLKDLWGFSQAQELAQVSPEMVAELIYPYQAKILEKFGLTYYGCCEANDKKFKYIKQAMPNLRAIAVSPWVDHRVAVEEIRTDYVYSWKPNPTDMIAAFDEGYIEREMKRVFEITKGLFVVVALRDTQTLYGRPERLGKWVEITKRVAMYFSG